MAKPDSPQTLHAGSRRINLALPQCMGVLNVTPDSFSDGATLGDTRGASFKVDPDKLLRRADAMVSEGAAFLDIGGESTRPGAAAVSVEEELERVVPAIELLRSRFDVCLSVDTSSADVMSAAIEAGAELVNDVRALADARAIDLINRKGTAVCLMHMRGQPRSMQAGITADAYADVVEEVAAFLSQRAAECQAQGVSPERLLLDPGFGFGKSQTHNFQLLNGLSRFRALGAPLLVAVSRKSMIGAATGRKVDQRLAGSVAAATLALREGASIIRAHDVPATIDAIRVHSAFVGQLALES